MRILLVTDFYPPYLGGVEVLVSTLASELARRGHEVSVATLAGRTGAGGDGDEGVSVHRVRPAVHRAPWLFSHDDRPWAPPVPDPVAVASLRAIVNDERPDVVHGHDWLARSFLPLKRQAGPRLVASLHYFTLSCPKKNLMHNGTPCTGPAPRKCLACAGRHYGRVKGGAVTLGQGLFAPLEARLVDLFLPVSRATAEGNGLVTKRLPYEVIPNFVVPAADPSRHEELLQALPSEPYLLFVGDIRRDKGVDVLLDAYARLRRRPPLVLIGEVWPDTPRHLPPGAVIHDGWPNAAVREAMRRCLTLVAPSVWPEPFGLVVVEALAAGRPVVASDIGGISEIVRDGQEGLLVPAEDAPALVAALDTLVGDPEAREQLAAGAERRAQAYAPDVVTPRFERAYERVLAGVARTSRRG